MISCEHRSVQISYIVWYLVLYILLILWEAFDVELVPLCKI